MHTGQHYSEDILEEFVMRKLTAEKNEQLEMHLLICPACREGLADTETFIASMGAIEPN